MAEGQHDGQRDRRTGLDPPENGMVGKIQTGKCDAGVLTIYILSLDFKGTVSPVLSQLTVVLLNIVESGEVPLEI